MHISTQIHILLFLPLLLLLLMFLWSYRLVAGLNLTYVIFDFIWQCPAITGDNYKNGFEVAY